jgi:hypothetical protein
MTQSPGRKVILFPMPGTHRNDAWTRPRRRHKKTASSLLLRITLNRLYAENAGPQPKAEQMLSATGPVP